MPALQLTPVQMVAKYPTTPITALALDGAFTAAGAGFALGAEFWLTGKEILIIKGGVAGGTVTISSVVDPYNRLGDITAYAIGAGEYAVFPQFQKTGWTQTGKLLVTASIATIEFLVLRLAD